ncbi:MATE family efflux transporter [Vibrio cholerae]
MTQGGISIDRISILRTFFRYAFPSVVTTVFFGTQNIIDGILVGRVLGPLSLASVNLVLPIFSIIMVIALIIGIGTQTVLSINLGRKEIKIAQDAITTGFVSILFVGFFATIFFYIFRNEIILKIGGHGNLFYDTNNYYIGLVLFTLPILACFFNDALLKALGYTKISMLIMVFIVITNISLSLIFISVLDFGVIGASLSTGISFLIGFVISTIFIYSKNIEINLFGGMFSFKILGSATFNGSSEGVSELAASLSILIVNLTILKTIGEIGVSAFTIINFINFTSVLIFLGISNGLIPAISYHYGAKNIKFVISLFMLGLSVNLIIGIIIFFVIQNYGSYLVGIFVSNENPSVIKMAENGIRLFSYVFLFNGLNISITAFFTSLGFAAYSIFIALLRGVVFISVWVLILPSIMGINGIWISIPLSEISTFFVAAFLCRMVFKRIYLRSVYVKL